jgi:oligopeptide transport system substrate-binding protein
MTFSDQFTSWSEFNDTQWFNDQYDAYIRTAMESGDNDVRMEAMKAAERLLMEEMPILPIYFYNKNLEINPKVTKYFVPVNRYVQLHYSDISK